MSIFIMFAPKKERQGGKREKWRRNETVGIHAWKSARDARAARKNLQPRERRV